MTMTIAQIIMKFHPPSKSAAVAQLDCTGGKEGVMADPEELSACACSMTHATLRLAPTYAGFNGFLMEARVREPGKTRVWFKVCQSVFKDHQKTVIFISYVHIILDFIFSVHYSKTWLFVFSRVSEMFSPYFVASWPP